MTSRGLFIRLLAASFAVALVGATYIIVQGSFLRPTTLTAIFTTATAIYPGDEVRVSGVKVGTVESIDPRGADRNSSSRSITASRSHSMPWP